MSLFPDDRSRLGSTWSPGSVRFGGRFGGRRGVLVKPVFVCGFLGLQRRGAGQLGPGNAQRPHVQPGLHARLPLHRFLATGKGSVRWTPAALVVGECMSTQQTSVNGSSVTVVSSHPQVFRSSFLFLSKADEYTGK